MKVLGFLLAALVTVLGGTATAAGELWGAESGADKLVVVRTS